MKECSVKEKDKKELRDMLGIVELPRYESEIKELVDGLKGMLS